MTERETLQRIWDICHRPSKGHPKGSHAYTHFMADFDEIRALCKTRADGPDRPCDSQSQRTS